MRYKQEKQKKDSEKLEVIFEECNAPEFIRDFFPRIASRRSRLTYWGTVKNYLLWAINRGHIKKSSISEVTPGDLNNITEGKFILYLEYLKDDKGILLTTLDTNKRQLSSFWEYMVGRGFVRQNIVQSIKSADFRPAHTNRMKLAKMPLYEDMEEMINKIGRKPDVFIRTRNLIVLRVLRGTGLRESELAGLDIEDLFLHAPYPDDVPLKRPHITVISKGKYEYSQRGTDIVWLTRDALAALEEWLEFRKSIEHIINKQAVFVNKNGKRLTESNIQDIFKTYSNGKITPHMIRHEAGTRLAKEDPLLAQEMLRHSAASITTGVYVSAISNSYSVLDDM